MHRSEPAQDDCSNKALVDDVRLDPIIAALAKDELENAQALCRQALADHADHPRLHAILGFIASRTGQIEQAIASYERAVAFDPDYAAAQYSLALLLEASGRPLDALPALEATIRLDPMHVDAQRRRIFILADLGRYDTALAAADIALAKLPTAVELKLARGVALRCAGRLDEALAVQEAILQDHGYAAAWAEKGTVLHQLGRFEAAMEAFDEALEQDGDFVYALNGMGLAELALGMTDAALAAFDKVLVLDPGNVDAPFYRAMTFEARGDYDAALKAYRDILRRRPPSALVYNNIGKIQRDIGQIREAEASLREALTIDPELAHVHSNLLLTMLYDPDKEPEALAAEHLAWGRRFGRHGERFRSWANDRDPERPLRVGVVAAEFGRHAVATWLRTSLAALDPAIFQLFCYSMREIEDDVSEGFKRIATSWRRVVGMSDQALATLIRQDAIDILIDISGHSSLNRLTCFALKPAPVQASWLGYPFTTGLDAIDYVIMDPIAVREGEERHFVETVARLPNGRFCFRPPAVAPDVVEPPLTRNDYVTFGSFNDIAKLTPDVLATWCRILHRLPNSRLILKTAALGNAALANRMRTTICATGIGPERIELRGRSDYATMLGEYGDIDIALDPFPFCGGATSGEALWMGLPLITLPGGLPVSRQTESYLAAIGRPEWIARDPAHYVQLAVDLSNDRQRLSKMRLEQRRMMESSSLCDVQLMGRELGDALRMMWRRFVDQAPDRP